MPYDEPEEDDPMTLVAEAMPGDAEDVTRMAEALVDEYARFGFDEARLLSLFRDPHYVMTHAIWRGRGEAFCADLAARAVARWRRPTCRR